MYEGLALASIIEDSLNSMRMLDRGAGFTIVVNDKAGNIATIHFNHELQRWEWEEGADQLELEEWARELLHRQQLHEPR